MADPLSDEIAARAIEQARRDVPDPTGEQAHDAVAQQIAWIAAAYWDGDHPFGIADHAALVSIRQLEHAARLLRGCNDELAGLNDIKAAALAFLAEESRTPVDAIKRFEAVQALRAACDPKAKP